MATSFLQKLRLGWRGWNRRRTEAAAKRQSDFVSRETSWGTPQPARTDIAPGQPRTTIDLEGLQVAYLDNSGRIFHYLDRETGEVIDFGADDAETKRTVEADPNRYHLVPRRSAASEAEDREAFTATVEKPEVRRALQGSLQSSDPASAFRQAVSSDRTVERAWYNFKNRRAAEAIERWLEKEVSFRA